MTLAFSVVVAALFGCGAYLLLKRDLVRVVAGITLVSQAAVLTVLASSLTIGDAPILPIEATRVVSDPLPQAMALTALVIGLASIGLVLALTERVLITRGGGAPSPDRDDDASTGNTRSTPGEDSAGQNSAGQGDAPGVPR